MCKILQFETFLFSHAQVLLIFKKISVERITTYNLKYKNLKVKYKK